MRIGSLFSGYGGLDLAALTLFPGSHVAWHCEWDAAPSKILDHHWPGVPNLHDVTQIDWEELVSCKPDLSDRTRLHAAEEVMPNDSFSVDILTGGYP